MPTQTSETVMNVRKRVKYDAVVIGGGIFGLYASQLLATKGLRVALLEKNSVLFGGASKVNQARVHRGYHYPRSLETAKKTADYYWKFCDHFHSAILKTYTQYYAIAQNGSKTSSDDYVRFCRILGIPCTEVDSKLFFKDNKVAATFKVEEAVFNYLRVENLLASQCLDNHNIDIFLNTHPTAYSISGTKYYVQANNTLLEFVTPLVINTTYNQINKVNSLFGQPGHKLKYELCELAVCDVRGLENRCITLMDGSFFSIMPFANGDVCTVSSVFYTPINTSYSEPQDIVRDVLRNVKFTGKRHTNWKNMQLLLNSYLIPEIECKYRSSLFEIKPILVASEKDDSRPTIITVHTTKPTFVSVMSGKISTIYDLEDLLYYLDDKTLNVLEDKNAIQAVYQNK